MTSRPALTPRTDRPAPLAGDAGFLLAGLLAGVALVLVVAGQRAAAVPATAAVAVALAVTAARRRTAAGPGAAQHDLLGVVDRTGLEQRLAAELARARRHGDALTVLHLDLVAFDEVNRRAGVAVGDEVLRRVALGMAAVLRGEDVVGRRGGDSFVAVLPGLTGRAVERVTARLAAVAERVRVEGAVLPPLRVAVGTAAYPADGATVEDLLRSAADRHGQARRARRVDTAPEPAPAAEPVRWRLREALWLDAGLMAAVAALWFALPLVAPADGARLALLAVLTLAIACTAFRLSRRTDGPERLGWRVMCAAAVLTFVPVVGSIAVALFGVAILLVAGDGWLRDRFRVVDAAVFAALVCGCVVAFALPSAAGWDTASTAQHVAAALKAIGVATVGATLLLVATSVARRARPDVWLLAAGYVVTLAGAVQAIEAAGAPPTSTAGWKVVSALTAANALAAMWLRAAHAGPAPRVLRDGRADGTLPVAASTAGVVVVIGASIAVHGVVPAAVGVALVGVACLRHVRSSIIAVDNRRLVALALRSQAERAAQHRASLVALTTALEARDGYTGRHGEETVSLAARVGEALGLGADERREVDTVALLHDVGKIGTPNEVLHKPGPLSDEEWEVMREHPVVGERILRTVPGLEAVARAVRHEHERWDGGGYPDGISGEEIPLASRIVLVCDAYHAMTSDRPYRAAMPAADALREVQRHAGSQFDPAVVHALVDVLSGERAAAPVPVPGPATDRAYQAAV